MKVKIVARWKPEDLAYRASDLNVYELCCSNGWQFGIDNSLHSKAFIFDSKTVLLGSANLTDKGLSLTHDGNLEVGTIIIPTITDIERLKLLEKNVFWLNDDTFNIIKNEIDEIEINKPATFNWSKNLRKHFHPRVKVLWISELLPSSPESFNWLNLDDEN